MSLLSVLDRVADHTPQPFIAPVPQANLVTVFSLQDDIPYRFHLRNPVAGWWNVMPRSKTDAVLSTQINQWEKYEYLDQLPRFYVIAIMQINESTWLCTPYNISDAEQRGWANAEPKNVFLVSGSISPMDVLVTRKLDQILLYDAVNLRITTPKVSDITNNVGYNRDFIHAYNIIQGIIEQEKKAELEAIRQKKAQELQEISKNTQLYAEHLLGMAGARLVNFTTRRRGYKITWEYDGAEFSVDTSGNLQVESAGICLAGTANRYSLPHIVHVMQEARRRNRFDLDRDLWL